MKFNIVFYLNNSLKIYHKNDDVKLLAEYLADGAKYLNLSERFTSIINNLEKQVDFDNVDKLTLLVGPRASFTDTRVIYIWLKTMKMLKGIELHVSKVETNSIIKNKTTSNTNLFFDIIGEVGRQKIIGVTGSKGKTTTTWAIYNLIKDQGYKVKIAGNFGIPPLELVGEIDELDYVVMEMSSYQLESIKYSPHIAIMTSLYPDHLDRHLTMENYIEAKCNIFKYQNKQDYFLISKSAGKKLEHREHQSKVEEYEALPQDWEMAGNYEATHYRSNLGVLIPLIDLLSLDEAKARQTMQELAPVEYRLEEFATFDGVTFVNDAIASLPEATIAALEYYKENAKVVILGGQDRGYSAKELANTIKEYGTLAIVLESEFGIKIYEELATYSNLIRVKTLKEAVEYIFDNYKKIGAGYYLLSTGAPSYGFKEFYGFEQKGNLFKDLVRTKIDMLPK